MMEKKLIQLGALAVKYINETGNNFELGEKIRESFYKIFDDEDKNKLPPVGKN